MPQYALGLTLPAIYNADNFVTATANADAHRWITAWPDWPAHAFLLSAPRAGGKTHLAHIWAHHSGGRVLDAASLDEGQLMSLDTPLAIDSIEYITDPRLLFHLYNLTREKSLGLLLTTSQAPQQLSFTLPDLTSRLNALPSARIEAPDDALVAALLRKQFADRQLKVDEDIITYLLPRIERSYMKISELITSLDEAALARHKKLTIPFIRNQLAMPSADAS